MQWTCLIHIWPSSIHPSWSPRSHYSHQGSILQHKTSDILHLWSEQLWPEAREWAVLSPPIRMIYISSWPHFQGGSDHAIGIFKFYQWHLLWVYQCFTQILVNLNIHQSRWSIYHLQLFLWDIFNLKSEVSNYHHSINLWSTSIQHVEGCSICTIILDQCIQPLEIHIRHPDNISPHIGLMFQGLISKMSLETAQRE